MPAQCSECGEDPETKSLLFDNCPYCRAGEALSAADLEAAAQAAEAVVLIGELQIGVRASRCESTDHARKVYRWAEPAFLYALNRAMREGVDLRAAHTEALRLARAEVARQTMAMWLRPWR